MEIQGRLDVGVFGFQARNQEGAENFGDPFSGLWPNEVTDFWCPIGRQSRGEGRAKGGRISVHKP